jgi:adenosylcobinamide-GDP ribazoletransferase
MPGSRTCAPPPDPVRAGRVYPVIGVLIGLVVGVAYEMLVRLNLPGYGAAFVALGLGAWITGALHETALARLAAELAQPGQDPYRDGAARARSETLGAVALIVAFGVKAGSMIVLPIHGGIAALVVTHALARAVMPATALWLGPHGVDEDNETARRAAIFAAVLGALVCLLNLPLATALAAYAAAWLSALAVGALARRQLGADSSDGIGAAEQVAECAILLVIASAWYE